jgi:hypothetical protein
MGKFLQVEKSRQSKFKSTAPDFSSEAKYDGIYRQHAYPFCLPKECAEENLFQGIRESALNYFFNHQIKWHDGQSGKCSNHLCDSMVCCVNFLFPFANSPKALAALLKPFFPNLEEMLAIEAEQYVAFEWIGKCNYLGEVSHNRIRTRGANYTSADAAVLFKRQDGLRQAVLIEWKYTEAYYPTPLHKAKSGKDRRTIYQHLFDVADCPIDKCLLPSYDDLFFEPFYQFMRQTFLAHEMEKAHELGANFVSLLHIAPAANIDFGRVTSPGLRRFGNTATTVWEQMVRIPDRFTSINTEALFKNFDINSFLDLKPWWDYTTSRYAWVLELSDG